MYLAAINAIIGMFFIQQGMMKYGNKDFFKKTVSKLYVAYVIIGTIVIMLVV